MSTQRERRERVYDEHPPMWLGGRQVCRGCGHHWPCPPMVATFPELLADPTFKPR